MGSNAIIALFLVDAACTNPTTTPADAGSLDDGGSQSDAPNDGMSDAPNDGPSDGSTQDAPDDAPDDAPNDGPTDSGNPVGVFAGADGTYMGDQQGGCQIGGFAFETDTGAAAVVVNPLGSNGAVTFVLVQGSTTEASATNLVIGGMQGHTCVLTRPSATTLGLTCTGPQQNQCTQTLTLSGT